VECQPSWHELAGPLNVPATGTGEMEKPNCYDWLLVGKNEDCSGACCGVLSGKNWE